ncbi:DUF6783 domain-containing protein, partial [Anaerosporobacter sp.]|uniref:DUF6783 domain-containing protein n=1 Tax=Anaerosporobacter sp. TaxID=1872529 RepID=UPI00286F08B8
MKNHCIVLHPLLSSLKAQNSVNVAHYVSQILNFHPTKWSAQHSTSIFQTHSSSG